MNPFHPTYSHAFGYTSLFPIPSRDEFLGRDVDADQHWAIEMFTNTENNTSIPIMRLPYEILGEIFAILVCVLVDNPVRLLLACKHWNEVATSTHILWSDIIFGDMIGSLELEEIWDKMPRMMQCTTVPGLVRAINRTGQSQFRLTILKVENRQSDDEFISSEDDQSDSSEDDLESFELADPACFENRCHSLRLMTVDVPKIILFHLNRFTALEELTILDKSLEDDPISTEFLRNFADNSPKLRVLRCANPNYLPEYEALLARLQRVHAEDDWIARICRERAVEKDLRYPQGHNSPTYSFIFNPDLDELGISIKPLFGRTTTPQTIRPETPLPPTLRKLTLSHACLIRNVDLYDRLTHLTLRRCYWSSTFGETDMIDFPCLTHLRLAGCKDLLGRISALNLYSLQIYEGIRVGVATWPDTISVRPKLLDIHWNGRDHRLMRLLECEWKDIVRLTLVIQSLKHDPLESLEGLIDIMVNNPDQSNLENPSISKSLHSAQSFGSSEESKEVLSSDDQHNKVMCPHLEYFTVLSLDPRLSAKDISTLKQLTEVQARRVSVARRNNGVFKGARIGWHSPFAFRSPYYIISETKEWGVKWKEII